METVEAHRQERDRHFGRAPPGRFISAIWLSVVRRNARGSRGGSEVSSAFAPRSGSETSIQSSSFSSGLRPGPLTRASSKASCLEEIGVQLRPIDDEVRINTVLEE